MKFSHYSSILFLITLWGCNLFSEGDQSQDDDCAQSLHDRGHPSDPPPCTTCNDLISQVNKDSLDIKSFDNYRFIYHKVDNIYFLTHFSSIENINIGDGESLSVGRFDSLFILDADTIMKDGKKKTILFPTGSELYLAADLTVDPNGEYIFIDKKSLKQAQNKLRNASLINAGFVKEDAQLVSDGYLSQDYGFLGTRASLEGRCFFMHVEPMVVYHKNKFMGESYFMEFAVDLLLDGHERDGHEYHALGNYIHTH